MLLAHGSLLFAHDQDRQEFLREIEQLPEAIRILWTTALERLPWTVASRRIEYSLAAVIDGQHDLATSWNGDINVALAERLRAKGLGLPSHCAAILDSSGIELVRMEGIHASQRFTRLLELAQQAIRKGEDREAVWRERLGPVAQQSRSATIVDRYVMHRHRARSQGGEESGLAWLLSRLGESGVRHVHLFCRSNRKAEAFRELFGLRGVLAHTPASLSVTFVPDRVFQSASHSRHIRFDYWVFSLDKGIDLFADQLMGQESPSQFGDIQAARSRERDLEHQAPPENVRLRVWPA